MGPSAAGGPPGVTPLSDNHGRQAVVDDEATALGRFGRMARMSESPPFRDDLAPGAEPSGGSAEPPVTPSPSEPAVVRGYVLRCFLVTVLREASGEMSVGDLCDALASRGLMTPGRPSKDVSDALRWEQQRGRVRRVGRGAYQLRPISRQQAWRMRRRLDDALVAQRRDG